MKNINKQERALLLLSLFAIIMSIGRVIYTGELNFLFLAWNLFLAWVPYLIGRYGFKEESKLTFKALMIIGAWLCFLPNAPYLITDFVHLNIKGKLKWLDIIILSTYALAGMLLFQISVLHFKRLVLPYFTKKIQQLIIIGILGSCAYGIYLGRVLRYNSWNVITQPIDLLRGILNSIFNPDCFIHTLYVTSIFMGFLYISVFVFDHLIVVSHEKKN